MDIVEFLEKYFNVSAAFSPDLHYMVDLTDRLQQIKSMVDAGQYFTINRARQYGKTTTLHALEGFLKADYEVVSMDFQLISHAEFENEQSFFPGNPRSLRQNSGKYTKQFCKNRKW